jgi:hypothetical protein
MKFYIKNNNLYYYNYLITDGRLSLFLIPLAFIILYNKKYIDYFSYIFVYIAVIGILDTIAIFIKDKLYLILFVGILFHGILFYPLIDFKKYFRPTIITDILNIIAILIIVFLPYWPYELTRQQFLIVFILLNIILRFLYNIDYINKCIAILLTRIMYV